MLRTLYGRLTLALVVLLLLIGVIYSLLSLSIAQHSLQQLEQQLNRDLAQNLVQDRHLVGDGRLDQKALSDTFMAYMTINPSIEIYLLDAEGQILAYSAEPGKVKRKWVDLKPIQIFLQDESAYPLLGDDPRSHDKRKIFSVTPVPSLDDLTGYLYVVLRGEQYDDLAQLMEQSYLLRLNSWALAGTLLLGLLVGLVLFYYSTRRLNHLAEAIEAFRQSDFTQPQLPIITGSDELARLGDVFRAMAVRISEQLEQLKQQDAQRRELIANVSHDLRTPLAVLHGYLQTIALKHETLSLPQQQDYIEAALRNSEHLESLVSSLFELAKLEAHETIAHCEAFSLSELIHDVTQTFQLNAEQQEIALKIECGMALPYVWADISMIERVVQNLLVNALQHTPSGGSITLSLIHIDAQVMVRLCDSGPGISEHDMPYIFERFYQAERTQHDNTHAGLGLAICRSMLQLHDRVIEVESTPGKGACFCFSLPTACAVSSAEC